MNHPILKHLQHIFQATSRLPASVPRATVVAEVLLLGVLMPALLLWSVPVERHASVLLALILVPLWLGLRFGLLAGSLVALTTAGAVAVLTAPLTGGHTDTPNVHMIVLLLTGLVSGEMRDAWSRRAQRLQALSQHHSTRLKQFTSAYQALQVSHSRMERQLTDDAGNLRAALQQLRTRSLDLKSAGNLGKAGLESWLLEMFSELGNLYAAALYQVNERGMLQTQAAASMGQVGALSAFHPMLRETLESGEMTVSSAPRDVAQGEVIALVPLVDARARVHGVLAIFDMYYASMQNHSFEALAVLGRHVGDILAGRPQAALGLQGVSAFKEALQREWMLSDPNVYPVALVVCTVTSFERRDELSAHLSHGIRGLDQCWHMQDRGGQPVILKTMPLTDAQGVASYLSRLELKWPGSGFGYSCHQWLLHERENLEGLIEDLSRVCALDLFVPGTPGGRKMVNGSAP